MKTNIHFLSYLTQFFLEWERFQTEVVEKVKTYISYSVTFFRKLCVCVCVCVCVWEREREIMWKNTVELDRPQMTCWTPEATGTTRICNTYCFSTAKTVVAQTYLSVTYMYIACRMLILRRPFDVKKKIDLFYVSHFSELVSALVWVLPISTN